MSRSKTAFEVALNILTAILFLCFWEMAVKYRLNLGFIGFENLPTASSVIKTFYELLFKEKFWINILYSIYRIFAGFTIALVLGVVLGFAIHSSNILKNTMFFIFELLRPIPGVAWIPISIMLFPSSETSIIFIIIVGAIYPILLNTIHGANSVHRGMIDSALSLGASKKQIYAWVLIPLSLPSIITGATIGMGTAWFCLITGEMISGKFGLGYFVWEAYILQQYDNIIVGMIMIGILGVFSSKVINIIGNKLIKWRDTVKAL